MTTKNKVAIIGTGMTALSIGHYLPIKYPQVQITFFDKGSKPGGRLATRRTRKNKQFIYDHGAPYLSYNQIKGDLFELLNSHKAIKPVQFGFIKPQQINFSKLCTKNLQNKQKQVFAGINGLDIIPQVIFSTIKTKNNLQNAYFQHRVNQIIQDVQTKQFTLQTQPDQKNKQVKQFGKFDIVICCIPYPQAKSLKQNLVSFQPKQQVNYHATWTVLISVPKGGLFLNVQKSDVIDFSLCANSPIKYAVKQNKKFQQLKNSQIQNWTLYFSDQWTHSNLNLTKQQMQKLFINQIIKIYGNQNLKYSNIIIHRWLYSSPKNTSLLEPLISQDNRVVFAGDWVGGQQNIGQCWSLGQKIVNQIFEKDNLKQVTSKL